MCAYFGEADMWSVTDNWVSFAAKFETKAPQCEKEEPQLTG